MASVKRSSSRLLALPLELQTAIVWAALRGWHLRPNSFDKKFESAAFYEIMGINIRNVDSESFVSRMSLFHTCRALRTLATSLIGECISVAFIRTGGSEAKIIPQIFAPKLRHVNYYIGIPASGSGLLVNRAAPEIPALESVTLDCGIISIDVEDLGLDVYDPESADDMYVSENTDLVKNQKARKDLILRRAQMDRRAIRAGESLIRYSRLDQVLDEIDEERRRVNKMTGTTGAPPIKVTCIITVLYVNASPVAWNTSEVSAGAAQVNGESSGAAVEEPKHLLQLVQYTWPAGKPVSYRKQLSPFYVASVPALSVLWRPGLHGLQWAARVLR